MTGRSVQSFHSWPAIFKAPRWSVPPPGGRTAGLQPYSSQPLCPFISSSGGKHSQCLWFLCVFYFPALCSLARLPCSCIGKTSGEKSRPQLRPPWQQETHLLPRRHEHARGGRVRHGAAPHHHTPTHGLQALVRFHTGFPVRVQGPHFSVVAAELLPPL